MESKYGSPKIVNDGVTVAREVQCNVIMVVPRICLLAGKLHNAVFFFILVIHVLQVIFL